jgi:hypothetical protein
MTLQFVPPYRAAKAAAGWNNHLGLDASVVVPTRQAREFGARAPHVARPRALTFSRGTSMSRRNPYEVRGRC